MFKKLSFIILTIFALAVGSFCLWLPAQHVTPILMYHKVVATDGSKSDTVSPEYLS